MSEATAELSLPLRNCYWVIPGLVLAGEYPGASTRDKSRERLRKLAAVGIQCFVDLTKPTELPRYDSQLPFNTEHYRKPIKDHSLPANDDQMVEILTYISQAIRARRPVYVHCRAGIGRTGTVIGCLLVERGLSGDGALDELNRLWQQSKRSRTWAYIPETEAQAEFIRKWKPRLALESTLTAAPLAGTPVPAGAPSLPLAVASSASASTSLSAATGGGGLGKPLAPASTALSPAASERTEDADPLLEPSTLAAAKGLRERFVGALLGLAVGDAVAAATQFRRPGTFTPIGDMLGGGPFDLPRGAWTDDTAMTLCLIDSLMQRKGFDPKDQVERYCWWQEDGYLSSTGQCVGISANTSRSLALSRWRRVVFPGSHDPDQMDPEPLSRVAAIALYFFTAPEEAEKFAAEASRTTCQAPAVLDACRRLARALNRALSGQSKTQILAEAPPDPAQGAVKNDTADAALGAAVWAFRSTDTFRDAVLRAANMGGNSDVVASVCGQLAGAHYGSNSIPSSWRNGLIQKDVIEQFADRLLAHALVGLSG